MATAIKILFPALLSIVILVAQAQKVPGTLPSIITGKLIRVTKPLRDMTSADKLIPDVKVRDDDGIIGKDEELEEISAPVLFPDKNIMIADPALQKFYPNNPHSQLSTNRAIVNNFDGIGYQPLNPPDPTLCAGPNHLIEMVNGSSGSLFQIYNKSGQVVVTQQYLDGITGKGGLGDPIALYDQLSDRFVLAEFVNKAEVGSEGFVLAISKTNDPTGSWYVYFFNTGTTFPDFVKFGVWNDAYYGTSNNYANGTTYSGSSVYAFDKARMIAGDPTATMQTFMMGTASKFGSMIPVSMEGSTVPPSGSGGLFAYMQDNSWTGTASDSIGLLEFKVDFINPANSKIITASSMATTAYKSDLCSATRGQCISQPGTSTHLEALSGKIMNQPVYRRFGNYEGIVFTHLVDRGANVGGARWYELRKTTGKWGIFQQSTYSPDTTHRWLPSICYDSYGNIALAYNVSSGATYPGAKYTGRKVCDSVNMMTYSEDVIIAGSVSNASTRYGDYNHLVCDPDGKTFWFACEYNSKSQWSTRIASFTLDTCLPAACGDPTGLTTSSITNTTATANWTAVVNAIGYSVDYKLSSATTWINAANNITATSVNLAGLTQASIYNWRVKANCSAGSGNNVSTQFTTTNIAPACVSAYEPNESTTSAAVIPVNTNISAAISTATDIDYYKFSFTGPSNLSILLSNLPLNYNLYLYNSSGSLLASSANTGTANETINYNNAASGSYFIKVIGVSGVYSATSCYTLNVGVVAVPACPGTYDASTNGTFAGAVSIPLNTDVKGLINPLADLDYYKFTITTGGTISISLSTLPANYDLILYNNAQVQLAISQNLGTTSELINYTVTPGTYYAYVYGTKVYNATTCYTLKVATGTASRPEVINVIKDEKASSIFPNPATTALNIHITGYLLNSSIMLYDVHSQLVMKANITNNYSKLDISRIPSGIYMVKIYNGDALISASKIVKQ